jgi:hypothetical protein
VPSSTLLVYDISGEHRQMRVPAEYVFDRSNYCAAVFYDPGAPEMVVSYVSDRYPVMRPGERGYVPGFETITDLAACDAAVPPNTTVVVIDGEWGQHATIFRGNGSIGTVRDGGKYRVALLGWR